MLFYFSGTGNSKWIAKQIADNFHDKLYSIPDAISSNFVNFELAEDEKIGFVFPIYSWGVPPIVIDFLHSLSFGNTYHNNYLYFICCCGDETGLAPEQFIDALNAKGIKHNSAFSVIMPNNYVLLPGFDVDSHDVMTSKLAAAPTRINQIVEQINKGVDINDCYEGSMAWLKSKLIYPLFVKWGISPNKFCVGDNCNGCKRCERICPTHNIIVNEKPEWGKNCTSCLACYHTCPQNAIRYGRGTKNKGQYFHL